MQGAQRARAEEILHRHEYRAACESELGHGCLELLHWMDTQHVRRALITRNTRKSVEMVLKIHQLTFDISITREDGKFKPDPAPLFIACEQLNVSPNDVWMVGDWKFDIEAANNGNIKSIWLSHGRTRPFEAVPWKTVENLIELKDFLQKICQKK